MGLTGVGRARSFLAPHLILEPMSDHDLVLKALDALATGDLVTARRAATGAAEGGSLLGSALALYLANDRGGAVYDQPAAFTAFIRGGGNVPLYAAVAEALGHIYTAQQPARLLDIGCGDGTALIPALSRSTYIPAHVDLIEPSAALLEAAVTGLRAAKIRATVRTWPVTAQDFVAELPDEASWPVVQSTFALHTLPAQERSAVLAGLCPHVGLLAVAEFSVPDLPPGRPEHLRFLAETYERGLAEYDADRDLVAQGFLMPVLAGQLAPEAGRATWEQPSWAWQRQLEQAGYTDVTIRPLYDYWSSPAFLLAARGTAPSGASART
jgi:SAM-dependent methyltransferase